jgi:hypothetical protein
MQLEKAIEYDNYKWHSNKRGYFSRKQTISKNKSKILYLHRYIWEKYRGPIKDGCVVSFYDKNPQNVQINNLKLIKRKSRKKIIYKGEDFYFCARNGYNRIVGNKKIILSRVIYEDNFGEIPPFTYVCFIDGNNKNISPKNLILSNSEEGRILKIKRLTGIKKKKSLVRACKVCGKFFDTAISKAMYCSHRCNDKHQNKKSIKKECVICNSTFLTIKNKTAKTCSVKCSHTLRVNTRYSIQKSI